MDLTILIVNWNTRQLVLECLDSVYRNIDQDILTYEVWVVDNASADGSVEAIRQYFPQTRRIVNEQNKGFAKANNQVLPFVASRYVLLLNSDTQVKHGAIEKLIAFMDHHPKAGIVAPQFLNHDGSKQNSFDNFPGLFSELFNKSLLKILCPGKYPSKRQEFHRPLAVDSVIGACMLVRTEAMEKVGYLDEDYFFFLEETDWCFRMWQAGYGVYHIPQAQIYHLQGASKKKAPTQAWIEYYRSSYLFFKKNKGVLPWLFFRLFRPVKLALNLFLTCLGLLLTFGTSQRFQRKLSMYWQLFLWHVKLCPDSMGLKRQQGPSLSSLEKKGSPSRTV